MAYPIPPWLTVAPAQFGEAAAQGARIDLGRAQLAEESRQARVRATLASQQMAQEAKAQQEESLRRQHAAEVSHEYEQAQIGLRARDLDQEQEQFDYTVKQAALKSAAQQQAARRIAAGEDPTKVWSELGPQLGLTGAGLSQMLAPRFSFKGAEPVPGRTDLDAIQTGPNQFRIMPKQAKVPTSLQSIPVLDASGQPIRDVFGLPGANGIPRIHNIPSVSAGEAVQEIIKAKQAQMGGAPAMPPASKAAAESALPNEPASELPKGLKEGQAIYSKSTGKRGRIINGVPVWDEEPEPETPVAEENAYPNTGVPGTTGFYYSGENYDVPAR